MQPSLLFQHVIRTASTWALIWGAFARSERPALMKMKKTSWAPLIIAALPFLPSALLVQNRTDEDSAAKKLSEVLPRFGIATT